MRGLLLAALLALAGCNGANVPPTPVPTLPDGVHSTWQGLITSVTKSDTVTNVAMASGGNVIFFTLCGDQTARISPFAGQITNLTVIYGTPCQTLVDVYGR
jgi:hypothetical protein